MVNRELKPVIVVSYTSDIDAYGQPQLTESGRRNVDMVIKNYTDIETTDIRYRDTTDIALTYDNDIKQSDRVIAGDITYDVLHMIHSRRLNQVFLKKI